MFRKVESVQVLDGNILRNKQRVICRIHQKAYTNSNAKEEVGFILEAKRKYERLERITFALPFTSIRDHTGKCTVNYKGTRMKTGK